MKTEYKTIGMACGHCATTITNKLEALDEVSSVSADISNKTIAVESNEEVSLDVLNAALDGTNYKLEK